MKYAISLTIIFLLLVSLGKTHPMYALEESFSCLEQTGPLQTIEGIYDQEKFEPDIVSNKKFDARNATFILPGTFSHSMVSLRGSGNESGICWAGGYFTASPTWHDIDVSWDQSKHGTLTPSGDAGNTTSATAYIDQMTWSGLHVYNVHDAIRTSNTENNWKIQHVWFDYIRDDCIENDHLWSGEIYDSLFDGCYSGISNTGVGDEGIGQTIKLDKVLLRMEPMPYPYKWDTKDDPVVYVPGYTMPDGRQIPFGNGNVFKRDEGNEPEFQLYDSVFLYEYFTDKEIFPSLEKVTACANNTIIWLGDDSEGLDNLNELRDTINSEFPDCLTLITDRTQGKEFWKQKVADWHTRHPLVGAHRKPINPGEYSWPRFSPTNASETDQYDFDRNGELDTPDALLLISSLINGHQSFPNPFAKADVNQDGTLNIIDVIKLISLILK